MNKTLEANPRRTSSAAPLFSADAVRQDARPIQPGESVFEFLNRCAWPEAERARGNLNCLFDSYPEASRASLARALQGRRENFEGAVFELYTYGLLRACGFNVQVNPTIGSGATPDFLVATSDGAQRFYVETTVIRGDDSRFDRLVYALNLQATRWVRVPGFAVGIRGYASRAGPRNPRPRHFARFLDRWFSHSRRVPDIGGLYRAESTKGTPEGRLQAKSASFGLTNQRT